MPSQEEIEAALKAQAEQERQAEADEAAAKAAADEAAAKAAAEAQARVDAEAAERARQAAGGQITDFQRGRNITKLTGIVHSRIADKADDSAAAAAMLEKLEAALEAEIENLPAETVARWIANPDLAETYVSWGLGELFKVGAVKSPRQSEPYTPAGGASGGSTATSNEFARLEQQYGKTAVQDAVSRIKAILPEGKNPRMDEVRDLLKESR